MEFLPTLKHAVDELGQLYGIAGFTLNEDFHAGLIFEDHVEIELHAYEYFATLYAPVIHLPEGSELLDYVVTRLEDNLLGFSDPFICWCKPKGSPMLYLRRHFHKCQLERQGLETILTEFYGQVKINTDKLNQDELPKRSELNDCHPNHFNLPTYKL